jgi:hypothetical protein
MSYKITKLCLFSIYFSFLFFSKSGWSEIPPTNEINKADLSTSGDSSDPIVTDAAALEVEPTVMHGVEFVREDESDPKAEELVVADF